MFTTGDEVIDAKHAEVLEDFPMFLPMDKSRGSTIIVEAFAGEDVGIPVTEIRPSKQTSKAGGSVLNKERVKGIKKKGGVRKKTTKRRK